MGNYRTLRVWETGHQITLAVYRETHSFPGREAYGITAQLRRAASSVPSNIAEGAGRNTRAEFARFCRIALGSANELDYQLLLARDLGYLPDESYLPLSAEVVRLRRMLARFIQKLANPDR